MEGQHELLRGNYYASLLRAAANMMGRHHRHWRELCFAAWKQSLGNRKNAFQRLSKIREKAMAQDGIESWRAEVAKKRFLRRIILRMLNATLTAAFVFWVLQHRRALNMIRQNRMVARFMLGAQQQAFRASGTIDGATWLRLRDQLSSVGVASSHSGPGPAKARSST